MSKEVCFETVDYVQKPQVAVDRKVKMYTESNTIVYPSLHLCCSTQPELFKLKVIKGLLENKSLLDTEECFAVYIDLQGNKVKIGEIVRDKLRSILKNKAFDVFEKKVYMDADFCLEGDMLYALCTTSEN